MKINDAINLAEQKKISSQSWIHGHYGNRNYYYTEIVSKGLSYQTWISASDLEKVSKYRWYLTGNGYAISWIKGKRLRMHHLIIGKPPKDKETDHINRNRLDNRKENLRFVSRSVNGQNTKAVGIRRHGNLWEHPELLNNKV